MIEKHLHNGLGGDAPKIKYSNLQGVPGASFRSFQYPHDILGSIDNSDYAKNETYTVTAGKVAYVYALYVPNITEYFYVDTVKIFHDMSLKQYFYGSYADDVNKGSIYHMHNPFIAKTSIQAGTNTIAHYFEVDEDASINPLTRLVSSSGSGNAYTVPTGKVFVLLNYFCEQAGSPAPQVLFSKFKDGAYTTIAEGGFNDTLNTLKTFGGIPMIFNEGDLLTTAGGTGNAYVNGYEITK